MRGWLIVGAVFGVLALYTLSLEMAGRWLAGLWNTEKGGE